MPNLGDELIVQEVEDHFPIGEWLDYVPRILVFWQVLVQKSRDFVGGLGLTLQVTKPLSAYRTGQIRQSWRHFATIGNLSYALMSYSRNIVLPLPKMYRWPNTVCLWWVRKRYLLGRRRDKGLHLCDQDRQVKCCEEQKAEQILVVLLVVFLLIQKGSVR